MNTFEVKVRTPRTCEDGKQRTVTDVFLVNAVTFGDAEHKVLEHTAAYGETGDIKSVRITSYAEVMGNVDGGAFFEAQIGAITLDEKTGREAFSVHKTIVQADDIEAAKEELNKSLATSLQNWRLVAIKEKSLVDIIDIPYTTHP